MCVCVFFLENPVVHVILVRSNILEVGGFLSGVRKRISFRYLMIMYLDLVLIDTLHGGGGG